MLRNGTALPNPGSVVANPHTSRPIGTRQGKGKKPSDRALNPWGEIVDCTANGVGQHSSLNVRPTQMDDIEAPSAFINKGIHSLPNAF